MSRVLIIGDTHCPGMRDDYVDFLRATRRKYRCDRFVHIGDLVDWHSISYHEKHPSTSSASEEYQKAKSQVAKLAKAFPTCDWMIGNHDSLTERQARTAGLPIEVLKDYDSLWEIDWQVHARFEKLEIDGVLYSHGDSGKGGMDSSFKQAKDNFKSTVIGHFHAQAGVKHWANEDRAIFGMNVGCGVDDKLLQFEYGRKYAARSIVGCGVVIDGESAHFEAMKL